MIIKLIRIFFVIIFFKNKKYKLVRLIQKLGASFIKLGQVLAVRPDIIGKEYAKEFSKLHDRVPPFKEKLVKKILNKELKNYEEIFCEFSFKPIAAASIAQVHKAKIGKQDVAVKILRPGINKRFKKDLKNFKKIAFILNLFKPLKRLRFIDIVDMLEDSVKKELDLRIEAASASQLKNNLKNDDNCYVPSIFWDYTVKNILVMEWVDGIAINNIEELKRNNIDLKKLAKDLAIFFFNQSYRDGFFHADTHPGNLFVVNGKIIPVDFGIMGSLGHKDRIFVAEILKGFVERDYEQVAKVHFRAKYIPKDQNFNDFVIACRSIGEPIFGKSAKNISIARLLAQLFQVSKNFNMHTQTQLLLLQKTLVLIEGVARNLDPETNIWLHAEPWIKNWAKDNLNIKYKIKNEIENSLEEIYSKFKSEKIIVKNNYLEILLIAITGILIGLIL